MVETDTVPKMRIANGIFLPVEGEAREPLGQRIIETPENVEATEVLRDDRYGFIAYVPVGSINKGAALVMAGGGGKATQCTICHGADLTGLGLGLRLARPLSQLSRAPALSHAARHAFRGGKGPMIPVVTKLTTDDMLAIAAYLASRSVPSASATAAPN